MTVSLLNIPTMLRNIIEDTVANQADIELITQPTDVSLGARARPHVVIAGAAESDAAETAEALLSQWPRSRILIIATGGRQAVMFEFRTHRTELGELSPAGLLVAIRSAAAAPGEASGDCRVDHD